MKNFIFLSLFATAFTFVPPAEDLPSKVGYADADYIFSQLPAARQADAELKSMQTQFKTQIETKTQELQRKYEDYIGHEKTMLEPVRINTQRELQLLDDNLQKFKQEAQTLFQNKEAQLTAPIYASMSKAMEEVARENGFSLIMNARNESQPAILYGDERINVSNLVLTKLGVTVKPTSR